MHELAVTKQLIDLVIKECRKNNLEKPKQIITELGELTTYKKDPIIFYYSILKKEMPILSSAELVVHEVKGIIKCKKCSKESSIDSLYMILCPSCDSNDVEIMQGKDFKLIQIKG